MSEYWKSTPRYWCKYCAVYVRDTKIERANHEATGKHQGAIKRSLRDLHRSHDREERDKDRARREIERLNGVIPGQSSSSAAASGAAAAAAAAAAPSTRPSSKPSQAPTAAAATEGSLKKQREQLAELGVEIPSSFRPDMAIPGEWTVTNSRVVETKPKGEKVESRASGVRKRDETEQEQEEEEAVRGLFKKPRRWGRDSKILPADDDKDLDALLAGSLTKVKRPPEDDEVKKEEEEEEVTKPTIKREDPLGEGGVDAAVKTEEEASRVKDEPDIVSAGLEAPPKSEDGDAPAGAVVFKKRKPKGLRTK
jgi:hypothetical protein